MLMRLSALKTRTTSSRGLRRFRRDSMPASATMDFRPTAAPTRTDGAGGQRAFMSSPPADRGQPPTEPASQRGAGPVGGIRRAVTVGEKQVPVVDVGIDQVRASRRPRDVADAAVRGDPRLDPTG